MDEQIAEGYMVKLKSGGPIMVVESVEQRDVSCVWFDKDQNLQHARFKLGTLVVQDAGASQHGPINL
ncbi:DUF2158 domain-containing protein [Kushneria phosphatilytica]|uniref:DUF2158 domain-containing protein n=1 Tax=Kushneria phosphatilytica TaxID=657387 RepID=A0A1S1NS89_9GAMM|nr:DUF2158 domain-containing protein [Kushneria phosphatilytica]OHV07799.1 hypothetical protein BH688_16620 [Kushneria phosphatilytica]QEL10305.1 DUF2158 domain-containing protein [Kushneria phosphatilytica]